MAVVGILALQGDFAEHLQLVQRCGRRGLLVKHAADLAAIDGLIIPGGESTTIAKLTTNTLPGDCIFEAIVQRVKAGMPVYGTCMGSIFLAREIEGSAQGRLAVMDITVRRNAFGPQVCSREQYLQVDELGKQPLHAVFIRGPVITRCGAGVQIMARVEEGIVMARQDNLLVTTFHPELTDDLRVHKYFLSMVDAYPAARSSPTVAIVADSAGVRS